MLPRLRHPLPNRNAASGRRTPTRSVPFIRAETSIGNAFDPSYCDDRRAEGMMRRRIEPAICSMFMPGSLRTVQGLAVALLLALVPLSHADAGWNRWTRGIAPSADMVALAIDPVVPTTIYAVSGLVGDLGGIFKSIDGGTHWSASKTGLTAAFVSVVAVDRRPLPPSMRVPATGMCGECSRAPMAAPTGAPATPASPRPSAVTHHVLSILSSPWSWTPRPLLPSMLVPTSGCSRAQTAVPSGAPAIPVSPTSSSPPSP